MPPVAGVRLATCAAGIRYHGRDDVMLAVVAPGSSVAGTFTRSLCTAAPVDLCKRHISASAGSVQALIVNSGNANAFTGAAGDAVARHMATSVAEAIGVAEPEVLVASTGVIGEQLPLEPFDAALAGLVEALSEPTTDQWQAAARAISTTDTFPKAAAATVSGTDAHIVGIAKGSGMIAPDMATMLAFIFTDMTLTPEVSQQFLSASVKRSFNRITVDSDTSTSDTVLLIATGKSSSSLSGNEAAFAVALDAVTLDLAHQITKDGEGATKFVTVTVTGAQSNRAAAAIARSIADSPLVKTALAASDANWGRIVAAVGKAGERADRDSLSIWIGDEQCAAAGVVAPHYNEERATEHLQGDSIELSVDVGVGDGTATIWTCDLTHGYIDINAGYRT